MSIWVSLSARYTYKARLNLSPGAQKLKLMYSRTSVNNQSNNCLNKFNKRLHMTHPWSYDSWQSRDCILSTWQPAHTYNWLPHSVVTCDLLISEFFCQFSAKKISPSGRMDLLNNHVSCFTIVIKMVIKSSQIKWWPA